MSMFNTEIVAGKITFLIAGKAAGEITLKGEVLEHTEWEYNHAAGGYDSLTSYEVSEETWAELRKRLPNAVMFDLHEHVVTGRYTFIVMV
jgi:hypothetical protein